MGLSGLEPPTSRLSGVRSNQLSYKPIFEIFRFQWRWRDSNSRPPACKAGALPTELHPHLIWHPPALPHRLQCSTIGRLRLNRRVRDGNGCFPQAHRYQKYLFSYHTFVPVLTLSRIRYASSRWSQSFIYIFMCMSSIWYASIPSVIHPRNLCTHSLIAKQ